MTSRLEFFAMKKVGVASTFSVSKAFF